MTEMTVTDARARLAAVVDEARVGGEPVYLTRHGRRVAAVVDADDLDAMIEASESLADIESAASARREMVEAGETPIPWEEVKAELGLT